MKHIFFLFFLFIAVSSTAQKWERAKTTKDGISVDTRIPIGKSILEYKAQQIFDYTKEEIVKAILNFNEYPQWVHKFYDTKVIKKINSDNYYYHTKIDSPWPVADRDMVIKFRKEFDQKTGIIVCYIDGVSSYIKEIDGCIRIKEFRGFWKIIPIEKNKTKLISQVYADPGGKAPSWAVNSMMVNGPVDTFQKLKLYLEANN